MHVQYENRSGNERRQNGLASLWYVEVENRSGEDRRAVKSEDEGDAPKNTLADAFLIAAMKKARNKR